MAHGTFVAVATVAMLVASTALAETHAVAPAGGGLAALDVQVDLDRVAVVANGAQFPVKLERARLPSAADVMVETVAIGAGKHVVHVRVPAKDAGSDGIAWETILAAGQKAPIFEGLTGLADGDPGERTGKAVRVVPDAANSGATSFVLVGDLREELGICGEKVTLLDPLAVYPSLDLRPATVQRLSAERRAEAQKIAATDKGPQADLALAKLLVARGSSVPGSRGVEVTDGDAKTAWSEQRPGVGQGEFVVMAAPFEVPIAKMEIVVAPASPPANGAAPKTFYIVTNAQTFEVTMPGDAWRKPGEAYEIAFPQPVVASCVALVLGDAFARAGAHPDVTVAELLAYSEFDAPGATLDDVAKRLSSGRGVAAAQVLERAGDGALAAVASAYDGLDARGRALAVDVAASHEDCTQAAPLLARALCEGGGQAPRKARGKLERCKGAAPALAQQLRTDPATRACIAPALAAIAPDEALEPIADGIAATTDGSRETRAALRGAFALALKTAPAGRLAALLGDGQRSVAARFEMMRAAEARVIEARAESEAVVTELLRGAPAMPVRYLVLGPLSELARSGDGAAGGRIAEAAVRDTEWPVRAHAARLATGLAEARPALVAAARDAEPRVREAALAALAPTPSTEGIHAAAQALVHDGWSFVRTQAIGVLANAPPSSAVDDALGGALHDTSVRVRGPALVALARRRAGAWRDAIRERLDDKGEDAEVRAAAARALGALCDAKSIDRLTELARALGTPGQDEDAQQLGFGALVGLAALQPPDLRARLAPVLAPGVPPRIRTAAQQALEARPLCR
jgi:hypothetical protein